MPALALLRQELRLPSILRTLAALAPSVVAFVVTGDPIYLKLCVVTVSLWAGVVRVSQSLWLLIGHATVLATIVSVLYVALPYPYVFTGLCAIGAFFRVYIARAGVHLRSLGDFTLLPAVYLACEIHATDDGGPGSTLAYLQTLEHFPISVASVVFTLFLWQGWVHWSESGRHHSAAYAEAAHRALAHIGRFSSITVGAKPVEPPSYDPTALAWLHFLAVLVTGVWVTLAQLPHGQWAILSATAVITGDLRKLPSVLRDQIVGVVLGVAAAVALVPFLTFSEAIYGMMMVGAALAAIAFSRTVVSGAFKAFFAVMIALAMGSGTRLGYERVEDVVAGVLTGVAVSLIVPPAMAFVRRRLVGQPTRKVAYCAAIFDAGGANASSISRRSFTAVRVSSIATSA
ncbi:MAG: FUSC family protein [Enhydrobacter sp.]|nr:FUSC family protein [Enhydrobacter sp.]